MFYDIHFCLIFLQGNNLSVGEDGGLVINEQMETTEKNVYAAGDACTPGWEKARHWFQVGLEYGLL